MTTGDDRWRECTVGLDPVLGELQSARCTNEHAPKAKAKLATS